MTSRGCLRRLWMLVLIGVIGLASGAVAEPAPSAALPVAVVQPGKSAAPSALAASALNPEAREFVSEMVVVPKSSQPATPPLADLMSRIVALRSRIAAMAEALFASRIRVELQALGEGLPIKSLRVLVDGGVVYTAPVQAFFEERKVVYEHAVAPGAHTLGVEVERQPNADARFSSWQKSQFVVIVPDKQRLDTRLELFAEGDLAEDFKSEKEGQWEVRVRLQVEVSE